MSSVNDLSRLELGKSTTYESTYNSERLFAIPRAQKRAEISIYDQIPFYGCDYWNHFEVSWLNRKGKPIVALARLIFDAHSPFIIESKSMKLYFNSLNNTPFTDINEVTSRVKQDLELKVMSQVEVDIKPIKEYSQEEIFTRLKGTCLDDLDITCDVYHVDPDLLIVENNFITEIVHSDLLRSNCLVTSQPDWGSVQIIYTGQKINHASLLKYIVSYRNHTEFGEHCVERIYMDILRYCKPTELSVLCCYTRRGGIDINCSRSTQQIDVTHKGRLVRQ